MFSSVMNFKHCSRSIGNSKSRETFGNQNGRVNPEDEATEMNETGSQFRLDDVSTDYASVQEARSPEHESQLTLPSMNQGPVYEDLGFGQGGS